ncbi:MAG: hypothetical protein LBJ14_00115 [Desulfarculales bacterium]|jgi:hypothetical protein|nr:hypothetical protein [Desulfarculales bacterium]
MDLNQYIQLQEAFKIMGYNSPTTLQAMARAGDIPGVLKIGRDWWLPRSWVSEYTHLAASAAKGGRPRGYKMKVFKE